MSTPEQPPARKRGRPRDPEIRVKVLTAAAAQFAERGYDGMTMEGIVAGSGVAKRTLYKYWPTKPAVIAEAILSGFLELPHNPVPDTGDIWADLDAWLRQISESMLRPYGDVLRASIAISTTDPALGTRLAEAFGRPALTEITTRLTEAVRSGQLPKDADLDAIIDLLMAIIVFAGTTRPDGARLPAALAILKAGITASA